MITTKEFISQYPLTEKLFKAILTNGADSLIHQAMIKFAKEAIKADRVNLLEHVKISIVNINVGHDFEFTDSINIVNKDSIINAANIELL